MFRGIVVVDEAYIDFASSERDLSLTPLVSNYPNFFVMQTLSKSFGLAGIRLGAGFADKSIIEVLEQGKSPPTQSLITNTGSRYGSFER